MKRIVSACVITVAAFAAVVSSGCHKKKDTIAKVYVVDKDNNRVAGARVVLKGESTQSNSAPVIQFDTTTTNSSGEAIFNFNDEYQLGQAGVAVLNIEATYGGLAGQGIIKIVEEETVEETVFVQ